MDYIGYVWGSPLIPRELFTLHVLVFISALAASTIFFLLKGKQLKLKRRILISLALPFLFQGGLIIFEFIFLLYILVPQPKITGSVLRENLTGKNPTTRVEIIFDRPLSRKKLIKSITPDTPGQWVFENPVYGTHLYRKLVFYPQYTLDENTKYSVNIWGISNFINISSPYDASFSFTTPKAPEIAGVRAVKINSAIKYLEVALDKPQTYTSEFNFFLSPQADFTTSVDDQDKIIRLVFDENIDSSIPYTLYARRTDRKVEIPSLNLISQKDSGYTYTQALSSSNVLGISNFSLGPENVPIDSPAVIIFEEEMDTKSVEENLSIVPFVRGQTGWNDTRTLVFTPEKWAYDTGYSLKISQNAQTAKGAKLGNDIIRNFTTIGRVKVTGSYPQDGAAGIPVSEPIRITFNQEVERESAQTNFSITPAADGSFSWEGNTLVFTPRNGFSLSTKYTYFMAAGVRSTKGLDSLNGIGATFTTQDGEVKLPVPFSHQKYSLSCEIASLKMALNYKGVNADEDELIGKVGFDTTARNESVWGDPQTGFVGNINGKQMADGYGVYWLPIAKAAQNYTRAQTFESWGVSQVTDAVRNRNPVIIWVYIKNGNPIYWNTPGGTRIYGVPDEHAVVAVGYVGHPDNPTHIIVNDPLVGQVYWTREMFERKWSAFGRSGVVIY